MTVRETRAKPLPPGAGGLGPLQERVRVLAADEKPVKDAEIVDDTVKPFDWKDVK